MFALILEVPFFWVGTTSMYMYCTVRIALPKRNLAVVNMLLLAVLLLSLLLLSDVTNKSQLNERREEGLFLHVLSVSNGREKEEAN